MSSLVQRINSKGGIKFQDKMDERPWRWLPDPVRYGAVIARAIYKGDDWDDKKISPNPRFKSVSSKRAPREKTSGGKVPATMPSKNTKKKMKRTRFGMGGVVRRVTRKGTIKKTFKLKKGLNKGRGSYAGAAARQSHFAKVGFTGLTKNVRRNLRTEQKASKGGATFGFSNKGGDQLVFSGTQRLGQIVCISVNISGGGSQNGIAIKFDANALSVTAGSDTLLPMNPTLLFYHGVPLSDIVLPFAKFKWTKFQLKFKTQQPTTSSGKFMLGFSSDVDWLEGLSYSGSTAFITESDISRLSNCKSFPVYEDFVYNMPVMQNLTTKNFYTRNEYTTATFRYVLDSAGDLSEDRASFQGMGMITGNPGGAAIGTVYGDLYLTYSLVLGELGQNARVATTPGPSKEERMFRRFRRYLEKSGIALGGKEQDEYQPGLKDRKETEGKRYEPGTLPTTVKKIEIKQMDGCEVEVIKVFEDEVETLPSFSALKLAKLIASQPLDSSPKSEFEEVSG